MSTTEQQEMAAAMRQFFRENQDDVRRFNEHVRREAQQEAQADEALLKTLQQFKWPIQIVFFILGFLFLKAMFG